jgi:FeoB-associated Cys-rich membrane protein
MDWQQAAALAIIAASFVWLLRRTFFSRGKKGGCSGCSTCSHAARPASPPQLVQLDSPREQPEERLTAPDRARHAR